MNCVCQAFLKKTTSPKISTSSTLNPKSDQRAQEDQYPYPPTRLSVGLGKLLHLLCGFWGCIGLEDLGLTGF